LVSHPQVSVFLKEQFSQPVSVVGAVNHPLIYQVIRPTTLLEVLAAAGGITDDAGPQVIISRPMTQGAPAIQPASEKLTKHRISKSLRSVCRICSNPGMPNTMFSVYGGDSVSVPRQASFMFSELESRKPGGYVMQSHGIKSPC